MAHVFPPKGLEKCVFAVLGQLQMNFAFGILHPEDAKHFVRNPELRKYFSANEQVAVRLLNLSKTAAIIRFVVTLTRPKENLSKATYILQIYSVAYAGTGTALASTATNLLETITFA